MIHYCLQEMFSTAADAVGSSASGMGEKLGEYESRCAIRLPNARINDGSRRETMMLGPNGEWSRSTYSEQHKRTNNRWKVADNSKGNRK